MSKGIFQRRSTCFILVLLILMSAAVSGVALRRKLIEMRQKEAENILFYYSEKIMLQLQGTMNEANALARTAYTMEKEEADMSEWVKYAARPLLERDEVSMVCLFEGDTLFSILPEDRFVNLAGKDLRDFYYIYTLTKVVKELVVEGPIIMDSDPERQEVFLFLQPILDESDYLGQVAVALDSDYVLGQLALEHLYDLDYDYELWRVEPQNGNKEVIASSRPDVDFSQAQKAVFYLPSQWTLSIQPSSGMISPAQRGGIILLCTLQTAVLLALAYLLYKSVYQKRLLKKADYLDKNTGLYNRKGFTSALDKWLSDAECTITLFFFSIEGYTQAARMLDSEEAEAFVTRIPERIDEYIHSPYIAGRLDAESYIIALHEDMDEQHREDFAKGLSLEFLLKAQIDGKRRFLMAHYYYDVCRPESNAEDEISKLIHAYYNRVSEESPVNMMTEKLCQLISGKNDVVFDEYTDVGMMELSKTFNRYRKQVEQIAYSDPVFDVGNRPKLLRDTNMLISYDKRRQFSLYCVDICDFSQYNELFSASIGDEILHEVLNRLARYFGSYLYRINGDVFLGVLLSKEKAESFIPKLQRLFAEPVIIGNLSLPLQVRIAVCSYPQNGETPGDLLAHIQSAMRFAKESGSSIAIYNEKLESIVQTEAEILRRLKEAICQDKLEVWYQPIMLLEEGQYRVAEALVRLPDGKGGYFSAGQVVSLAERNGIVEELGYYVLNKSCVFMKEQGDKLGIRRIGVNLSVQQLLVGNSADHLLEIIHSAGVNPHRVTLEITESILIQSIDRASEALDKLRQAGIHIALDDFGMGYSSLNYLSNLPVDIIKIDRSLTQEILTSPKQFALLKSIVQMASINSLIVVAEGVETKEEKQAISESGVQYIQGYYYAKPMYESEFIRFMEASARGKKY